MPAQQSSQLILKTRLAMVFLLRPDVSFHLIEVRLAYRKICIPALPFEILEVSSLVLDPKVRYTL